MDDYIEFGCKSGAEVVREIAEKRKESFEFVSVVIARPAGFVVRMRRKAV